MNYELFERKSWNQDVKYQYHEIFEYNKIEYEIERNQRMNQKYINN